MNLTKLSILARKTHRLLVLLIIIFGLPMTITGTTMKYPYLSPIDESLARSLHNLLSPFFALIFLSMMLTGGYMYIYPWLQKYFRKPIS
ncbi:hypothetical protein A2154_02200 [Candidatus Gottesmanbacteria bacterium RBG_16_43_7]|uniref:Cytochrome b561 bacterial/Ni-hydrogenase domain-containing protein n=1 Tax=Candidatus Gottesmanbacteria bacterium RBG_16_43_7 TaxID=1798373 RepID=A0A1F5Z8X0_9BACT|nr:MAG: hypothetical protein A2154_02200 [Candidatus Gottesmanbacteria bacterium RBG_16_43_7]